MSKTNFSLLFRLYFFLHFMYTKHTETKAGQKMDRKDSATPFKNFEYRYINQPLLNNLVIMDLGHERCPATKPQIGPEHRNHVSLHLVTSGKGILVIDQ